MAPLWGGRGSSPPQGCMCVGVWGQGAHVRPGIWQMAALKK